MHVTKVLQDGSVFDAKVLDLSIDSILGKFRGAVHHQASLSLAAGYPTALSAPHSLLNGFKNLVAVCADSGYGFPQADALLAAAKNAPAAGAAPAGGAEAAAAKDKTPEKEKDEDDVAVDGMGNLFGDDEDDY